MQKNDAFRTVKNAVPNPDWVFIEEHYVLLCKNIFLKFTFPFVHDDNIRGLAGIVDAQVVWTIFWARTN